MEGKIKKLTDEGIDFNIPLKDLEGNDIPQSNMGKILANTLVTNSSGDALKFWDWALKLHNGALLILDNSDKNTLKTFIEQNESLTILSKAQLLILMS